METKKYLKTQLFCLIIPAIAIAVGLIWPSFYWFSIGVIVMVIIIINTAYCLFKHSRTDDDYFTGAPGGCALVIVAAVFSLAYLNFDATRYITPHGKKLHLYEDCTTFLKGSSVKKVVELEGFFHLCFKDCNVCLARKEMEREQKKLEAQRRREEIARVKRNNMIDVLLDAIEELRSGKSMNSVGYTLDEFLYEEGYCERINEEEYEEYDDYSWGIPSRYQ